jgi:hypothetical protein
MTAISARALEAPRLAALSAAAGVVLGVLVQLQYSLPGNSGASFANLGAPWVAVAFALGTVAASRGEGALAGVFGLICGLVSFYLYMRVVQDTPTPAHKWVWFVLAVPGGGGFGALGTYWRSAQGRGRINAVALMTVALAGEGASGVIRSLQGTLVHTIPLLIFVIELVLGLATPIVLLGARAERARAYTVAITWAAVVLAASLLLTAIVHHLGS